MILIASPGSSVKPKYVKPKQRVCGPDSAKSPHWGSRWCATVRSSLPFANRLLGLQGLLRPALFILIRRLRKGAGLTREAAPLPLIHTPMSPVTSGASDRRTGAVLVSVIRQHWRQASRCRLNEYGVSCSAPTSSPGTEDICAARAMNPEVDDPTRPMALVRGCGQAYALQTVEPVTYRCGTRRVCQARSSGSERYTRARPHAVAPMNCVPEDSRRRSTCTGRTHSPRARADGNQTPSSTVAVRAPSPS